MTDVKKILNDDEVENINGGLKAKVVVINDEDDLVRTPIARPVVNGKDDPGENSIFKNGKTKKI